ncbi:uncharacterized protein LOC126669540 isoform X1 [Mercurialis annua]|uniref:uncharacterized protein LOC126669540 isoform X1 n=1 Tax=Mercurialis annua TaxID=3986 RepID=UPI00215FA563|nr:uncharacterized protein LOC126669540 isoform X1 [Mercurialis annua]
MPKKNRGKQSKEMKNSVQEEAIRELEEAAFELEQFSRKTKNSSIRSRLSFHIKELKKSPIQHPEPITLRAWLKMDQNRVVTAVPVARLTDKAKALIRGFLKDFRILYLQGKAHGRITSDNIIIYDGTSMLINRQYDLVGDSDTIKADFAAIKSVIRARCVEAIPVLGTCHIFSKLSREKNCPQVLFKLSFLITQLSGVTIRLFAMLLR